MTSIDAGLLVIRLVFGLSMVLHGWNKWNSPNGINGTTSWFSSIGMKWPRTQAVVAATSEIVAGALFALGLFTGPASAIFVALMTVAIVTVHWKVGYFIFLAGGGWEYCAAIIAVASAVAMTGPGAVSLDNLWDIPATGSAWAFPVGVALAVCHLAISYRPPLTSGDS